LLGASPGASTAVSIMVEVLEKSVLFLNDKHNLKKKINDLIYPELSVSENYNTFIIEIKKRFKKLDPLEERFMYVEVKGADHGFMCEERESFHKDASLIGWNLLMKELN